MVSNPKKRKYEDREEAGDIDRVRNSMLEQSNMTAKRLPPALLQKREREALTKRPVPAFLQ